EGAGPVAGGSPPAAGGSTRPCPALRSGSAASHASRPGTGAFTGPESVGNIAVASLCRDGDIPRHARAATRPLAATTVAAILTRRDPPGALLLFLRLRESGSRRSRLSQKDLRSPGPPRTRGFRLPGPGPRGGARPLRRRDDHTDHGTRQGDRPAGGDRHQRDAQTDRRDRRADHRALAGTRGA